ncbi:C1 family peptidase [Endozoicomonas numazuensis]|nr:C1 family peptidase [Endozoicomonas numazuensis]
MKISHQTVVNRIIVVAGLLFSLSEAYAAALLPDKQQKVNQEAINPEYYQGLSPEEAYQWFRDAFSESRKSTELFVLPETEEEISKRATIFNENLQRIIKENAESVSKGESLRLGITAHADLTQEEFQNRYLTLQLPAKRPEVLPELKGLELQQRLSALPDSFDWRDKGVITSPRNQWFCGSCWAFSGTEAVESFHAIHNNMTVTALSVQQVLDCTPKQDGCKGAWPGVVMDYSKTDGICPESCYRHYYSMELSCKKQLIDKCPTHIKVGGYASVPQGDDKALQVTLLKQPVSVSMEASSFWFQFYLTGVFKASHCHTPAKIDHAMLLVGYGRDSHGEAFWLIKNNWGSWWGQKGYVKVQKDKVNTCGISSFAIYPTSI